MAARATKRPWSAVLLPALLLAGCLGLGWVIYHQLMASPTPRTAGLTQTAALLPDLPEPAPFVMPPAADFAAVVERPLFSPSRRPPTEASPVVTVTEEPIDIKLTGIVLSGNHPVAIFQPEIQAPKKRRTKRRTRRKNAAPAVAAANANTSIRLSEGDRYKGWTLDEIESKTVLFSRNEEISRLEISFDVAAPPQPRRTAKVGRTRRAADQDENEDDMNAKRDRPEDNEAEGTIQ
jgi:hypothetical protein